MRTVRQKKETKEIKIGKEELKLSLFTDNMILYPKDLNDTIRKLLDLTKTFNKVAGYRINTYIPITHILRKKSEK
jgi:hypothetical protein